MFIFIKENYGLIVGLLSLLTLLCVLTISQRPNQEQLQQSVNQGQHQSEANYWRAN